MTQISKANSMNGIREFKVLASCFLFLLLLFQTYAEPNNTLNLDDWWPTEPGVSLNDSALMRAGLYDEFTYNDGSHDITNTIIANCRPKQIHLSIGRFAWTSMTVSFMIPNSCSLEEVSVLVVYGENLEYLKIRRIDPELEMQQYTYSTNGTDYYQSGSIFHVPLTKLKHSQKYVYQICVLHESAALLHNLQMNDSVDFSSGSSQSTVRHRQLMMSNAFAHHSAKSPILSFQTSSPPENHKGTKMAIVGDLGQTYNSTVTMLHMYRHTLPINPMESIETNVLVDSEEYDRNKYTPASIVLCAGDMSYSDKDQNRWDSWFDLIEPLLSKVPLQVAVGNHELECDFDSHNVFTPYATRFYMPQEKPGFSNVTSLPCHEQGNPYSTQFSYEYGNSYYAFTQGITRVIVLNSYGFIEPGSDQFEWLLQELKDASANRETTPWIIVMSHVPLYNTFSAHQHEYTTIHMLHVVEPLFIEHRVNFVFSGHAHGYSRSTNVAYEETNPTGPIYITVGEGGNREHHSRTYRNMEPEEWIVKRDITEYGFGTLEFFNSTLAQWKWIRNENFISSHFTDSAFTPNQYFV